MCKHPRTISQILFLNCLTIVCILSMLAIIVLILQLLRCRLNSGVDRLCTISHFCHLFQYYRIVDSLFGILAPGKRPMVLAQNGRHCFRILTQTFELINDQVSGIFLISVLDFFLCQAAHTGNRAIDIVCMSPIYIGVGYGE